MGIESSYSEKANGLQIHERKFAKEIRNIDENCEFYEGTSSER